MTTDRELMQQALDALEEAADHVYCPGDDDAIGVARKALRARLAQPEQESAYGYASRLATAIWEKHYKDESPHWKVNDSLLGVLTQIDNMTTGLVRAQPEQEIETDRDHVEDDGCPTEKAVLQRFWREHQKQEPVAWRQWVEGNPKLRGHWMLADPDVKDKCLPQGKWQPLYTAPPQREWQGLTDEEMFSLWVRCPAETEDRFAFARAIEQALKEKNT